MARQSIRQGAEPISSTTYIDKNYKLWLEKVQSRLEEKADKAREPDHYAMEYIFINLTHWCDKESCQHCFTTANLTIIN